MRQHSNSKLCIALVVVKGPPLPSAHVVPAGCFGVHQGWDQSSHPGGKAQSPIAAIYRCPRRAAKSPALLGVSTRCTEGALLPGFPVLRLPQKKGQKNEMEI